MILTANRRIQKKISILIIDDHPMVVRGYQLSIENELNNLDINFKVAYNCSDVLNEIKNAKEIFFDLVLLDINLPASKCNLAANGEDIGILLRKEFPTTKIIVHTGLNEMQRITNIFHSIRPEGFLIKSDINENVLHNSIIAVLNNQTYFSSQFKNLLSPQDFKSIYLDSFNRKILYHLSLGYKMKELPDLIPLSMPTIERRKKNIRSLLGVTIGGNKELLKVAKEKGFI